MSTENISLGDTPVARVAMAYLKVHWALQDFKKIIEDEVRDERQALAVAQRLAESNFDLEDSESILAFLKREGIEVV